MVLIDHWTTPAPHITGLSMRLSFSFPLSLEGDKEVTQTFDWLHWGVDGHCCDYRWSKVECESTFPLSASAFPSPSLSFFLHWWTLLLIVQWAVNSEHSRVSEGKRPSHCREEAHARLQSVPSRKREGEKIAKILSLFTGCECASLTHRLKNRIYWTMAAVVKLNELIKG